MRPAELPTLTRRTAIATGLAAAASEVLCRGLEAAEPGAPTSPLIAKPIPATGETLPVIGLGTNAFTARTPEELEARRAVLRELPRLGGKVVDTAAIYGQSEQVIGDTLAALGTRELVFLSTKVMAREPAAGKSSIEESFRRLKTQRIDLFEIHNLMGLDTVLPLLQELKQAGRVRYIGVTTSNPADHQRLIEAMRRYPFDFIQVDYSLGNRGAADAVLPLAQARRMGVLVNVPFGGRRGANLFTQIGGRQVPAWAAEFDARSWGQFFLKYVVSHPAVTCAIPGTTDLSHLTDNLAGGRGRLPDAAMRARMEQFWDTRT